MASIRTEITEIVTGLAMLGFRDLDEALLVRPLSVVNLTTDHYERLDAARRSTTYDRAFETAWENGRIFARADDGLRGRPPWTIEWKGPHRPPGYEQVPADLRVDHVYLVSCKYGSSILHNVSPSHLFDRALSERKVSRTDWFHTTAPEAYQAFYEACLVDTDIVGLPASVAELDKAHRERLKAALPKRGRLPEKSQQAYEQFSAAVAMISAERWRAAITTARQRETMVWRLLRLQAAPYFVLGATTSGDPLRYRVGTPWDFRSRFEVKAFDIWPDSVGQPMVRWRADVAERQQPAPSPRNQLPLANQPEPNMVDQLPLANQHEPNMVDQLPLANQPNRHVIEGHVEIRWTHGRFSGAPEAKVHLDTHPHLVPGYFPLV